MNVDEFHLAVKKAAQINDNDVDWTKAAILKKGTETLRDTLYTKMPQLRQGYGLVFEDQFLQPNALSLRVPTRALGGVVEKIAWRRSVSDDWSEVPVLLQGQALASYGSKLGIQYTRGSFFGYHITSGEIRFTGKPAELYQVRIWYYLRHPELVETTSLVVQDLITTDLISMSDTGCSFTATPIGTTLANLLVDIVDTNVSQIVLQSVVANKNSGSLTVNITATPNGKRVSDVVESFAGGVANFPAQPAPAVLRIYKADETDTILLQKEYNDVAVLWTAAGILMRRGDFAMMQKNIELANALSTEIQDAQVPRVKGTTPVMVRTTSYLRNRRGSAW